jgi:hypothetical protein
VIDDRDERFSLPSGIYSVDRKGDYDNKSVSQYSSTLQSEFKKDFGESHDDFAHQKFNFQRLFRKRTGEQEDDRKQIKFEDGGNLTERKAEFSIKPRADEKDEFLSLRNRGKDDSRVEKKKAKIESHYATAEDKRGIFLPSIGSQFKRGERPTENTLSTVDESTKKSLPLTVISNKQRKKSIVIVQRNDRLPEINTNNEIAVKPVQLIGNYVHKILKVNDRNSEPPVPAFSIRLKKNSGSKGEMNRKGQGNQKGMEERGRMETNAVTIEELNRARDSLNDLEPHMISLKNNPQADSNDRSDDNRDYSGLNCLSGKIATLIQGDFLSEADPKYARKAIISVLKEKSSFFSGFSSEFLNTLLPLGSFSQLKKAETIYPSKSFDDQMIGVIIYGTARVEQGMHNIFLSHGDLLAHTIRSKQSHGLVLLSGLEAVTDVCLFLIGKDGLRRLRGECQDKGIEDDYRFLVSQLKVYTKVFDQPNEVE